MATKKGVQTLVQVLRFYDAYEVLARIDLDKKFGPVPRPSSSVILFFPILK